jgi:hypothetical protein
MLKSMFKISMVYFAIGMAILEILVSWLKSFKYMAFTSILGDIALLVGEFISPFY